MANLSRQRQWQLDNPKKDFAHRIKGSLLTSGKIQIPDKCSECEIGCKPESHHPDYNKPYDIVWLCKSCHQDKHNHREHYLKRYPKKVMKVKLKKIKCVKCKHEWTPRQEDVRMCPNCKTLYMENKDKYMSVKEVAEYLGLSISAIYEKVSNVEIPFYQPTLNGKLYFNRYKIDEWMKGESK